MVTVIVFLIVIAIVGTVGYFALSPLVKERWNLWQAERREAEERQWRQRHQKILQEQATARVLAQFKQQEEQVRNRRKAA